MLKPLTSSNGFSSQTAFETPSFATSFDNLFLMTADLKEIRNTKNETKSS